MTGTSLQVDRTFSIEKPNTVRALFYGLGSDGTVGANKNSIKIIGTETDLHAQGYFVYDSKKSGSVTVSHLRFGPEPIHAPYLIESANFVACHQFNFLERFPVLSAAEAGASFLLNSPFGPHDVSDHLPRVVQSQIIEKKAALVRHRRQPPRTGHTHGRPRQHDHADVLFRTLRRPAADEAIVAIKHSIEKTYGKRGEAVVRRNFAAVDTALSQLYEVAVPEEATSAIEVRAAVPPEAPEFVQRVTAAMIAGRGDELPTSALPVDGTYPSGTTRYDKRNIAQEIPVWDADVCIQCDKCVLVCPHAVIRAKVYSPSFAGGGAAHIQVGRCALEGVS